MLPTWFHLIWKDREDTEYTYAHSERLKIGKKYWWSKDCEKFQEGGEENKSCDQLESQ